MKILMYSIFIVLLANGFDKCEPAKQDETDYKLGDTIDLPLKESIKIKSENLEVAFANIADSRCPLGVNCIQAGKANVSLELTKDGKTELLELESKGLCQEDDGSCGSMGSANGYNVKLINVYPYPSEPKPDEPKAVYARVIVSK